MMGKSHMVVTTGVINISLLGSYFLKTWEDSGTLDKVDVSFIHDSAVHTVSFLKFLIFEANSIFMSVFSLNWHDMGHFFNGYTAVDSHFSFGIILHILLLFLLGIIGSILPDIDSETSYLGRYFPFSKYIPHRTITHTIWAILCLMGIGYFVSSPYYNMMVFGYFWHILEDTFSKQGIAWFNPFSGYVTYGSGAVMKRGRKPKFFYYRTGSRREKIIRYIFTGINWMSGAVWLWIIFVGITGMSVVMK